MDRIWAMLCWTLLILLVVGVFSYERMIWNECRETNSFFYCMKLMSR